MNNGGLPLPARRHQLAFHAFPVALAEGLADAPPSKLKKIKISPNGRGLHWPLLDADLYVPGLIEGAFGSRRWMQQIGKLGG